MSLLTDGEERHLALMSLGLDCPCGCRLPSWPGVGASAWQFVIPNWNPENLNGLLALAPMAYHRKRLWVARQIRKAARHVPPAAWNERRAILITVQKKQGTIVDDASNRDARAKMILDAMTDCALIADDNDVVLEFHHVVETQGPRKATRVQLWVPMSGETSLLDPQGPLSLPSENA